MVYKMSEVAEAFLCVARHIIEGDGTSYKTLISMAITFKRIRERLLADDQVARALRWAYYLAHDSVHPDCKITSPSTILTETKRWQLGVYAAKMMLEFQIKLTFRHEPQQVHTFSVTIKPIGTLPFQSCTINTVADDVDIDYEMPTFIFTTIPSCVDVTSVVSGFTDVWGADQLHVDLTYIYLETAPCAKLTDVFKRTVKSNKRQKT